FLELLHMDLFSPSVVRRYGGNSTPLVIVDDYSRKIKESLNVTFDETPPPSKTSPFVDDDFDEEEAIKNTEKKNLENDIVDETLEIDEIVNIKESKNYPLENVIGNLTKEPSNHKPKTKAILSGADNHPLMLEKDMYDSWKSRMELYMLNREHEKMILELVEHGPLLWPIIEEDEVTRLKKYSELSAAEAIQADYDVNTKFLNTLLPEWTPQIDYALIVHHSSEFSSPKTGLVVPVFQKGDDPIDTINQMMSFLTAVVTLRYPATNN
nr:retrovirus-related Pol polyprotein from transposon TNT 1-94 [Tanacetum cinerariifolium]